MFGHRSPKVTRPASYHPEGHLARRDSLRKPSQHALDARFTRWCPKSHWGTSVLCGRSGTPRGYNGCTRAYVLSPATHVGALLTRRVRSAGGNKKPLRKTPVETHLLDVPPCGAGSFLAVLVWLSTAYGCKDSPSSSGMSTVFCMGLCSHCWHMFSKCFTSNRRLHDTQYPCSADSSLGIPTSS